MCLSKLSVRRRFILPLNLIFTRMNKLLLLLIPLLCFACSTSTENQETTGASPPERSETYPQLMHEIWEAHGGIEKWQQHKAITFTITRPPAEATEVHQVNL